MSPLARTEPGSAVPSGDRIVRSTDNINSDNAAE